MKKLFSMIAVGAIALTGFTGIASANTITVSGTTTTIDCAPSCQAFTLGAPSLGSEPDAAGTPSSSSAWYYDGTPSSETDEANRLNILTGGSTSFTMSDGVRDESPADMFSTMAEYVVLKLGQFGVYIINTSGGLLTLDINTSSGFGLSHVTEFGEVNEIPIPGALWLMGAGLAGLGFARRKNAA